MSEKLAEDRRLLVKLFRSFTKAVGHALTVGAQVYMELPRLCGYWKYHKVRMLLKKYNFNECIFDGCMYDMTTADGGYIKKPWRVVCLNSNLPDKLNAKCDRTHQHITCTGPQLARTQMYTMPMVNVVHQAICLSSTRKTAVPAQHPTDAQQPLPCAPCVAMEGDAPQTIRPQPMISLLMMRRFGWSAISGCGATGNAPAYRWPPTTPPLVNAEGIKGCAVVENPWCCDEEMMRSMQFMMQLILY